MSILAPMGSALLKAIQIAGMKNTPKVIISFNDQIEAASFRSFLASEFDASLFPKFQSALTEDAFRSFQLYGIEFEIGVSNG